METGSELVNWVRAVSGTCGLVGIAAMAGLFPILGRSLLYKKEASDSSGLRCQLGRISILIPAHDEERTLGKTLESILSAVSELETARPEIKVDIRVAADGCRDATARVARSWGVYVVESLEPKGKWKTLHLLLKLSRNADWTILA